MHITRSLLGHPFTLLFVTLSLSKFLLLCTRQTPAQASHPVNTLYLHLLSQTVMIPTIRGKSFLVRISALEKECAGIILHQTEKQNFLDQSKGRHSFIFIKRLPFIAFYRYDNICLHSFPMRDASRRMIIH